MKERIFRPRLSRWILGLYWAILTFLGIFLIGVPVSLGLEITAIIVFLILLLVISAIFIAVIARAYGMKFTVAGDRIVIRGIFRTHTIDRKNIALVQKTPIPFGVRLFGASFLGGYYYFPGIGKAWVSMGNFSDGVMIKTKKGKLFVLTPHPPEEFIKAAGK